MTDFFYCKTCLMPSTRPRIRFDADGICNACNWAKRKQTLDWGKRQTELWNLCAKYKGNGKEWDIIVPFSGGKDSFYIAHQMKHTYKMNPLLVYIPPLIPSKIGRRNVEHFKSLGYSVLEVCPDCQVYIGLCKRGLIDFGMPQWGFEVGLTTIILRVAIQYQIPFIMYGEEGETEDGGKIGKEDDPKIDLAWAKETYFSGNDIMQYEKDFGYSPDFWQYWTPPSDEEIGILNPYITHWSYFHNWDSRVHLAGAEKLGFKRVEDYNDGAWPWHTSTNYNSLDDPWMRSLTCRFMYLKFGFGRGTDDVKNEVWHGRMTRENGFVHAWQYDDYDCLEFRHKYLNLFNMTETEFLDVEDKWANKDILVRTWKYNPFRYIWTLNR